MAQKIKVTSPVSEKSVREKPVEDKLITQVSAESGKLYKCQKFDQTHQDVYSIISSQFSPLSYFSISGLSGQLHLTRQ